MKPIYSRLSQILLIALFLIAGPWVARGAEDPAAGNNPAPPDEQKLIAVLKSGADLHDKAQACEELAIVGTKEAVPVLAGLLNDEKLSHYARLALEAIPDESAADALMKALETLKGERLIGVIGSLGARREERATRALVKLVGDKATEPAAASAALIALGHIATRAVIQDPKRDSATVALFLALMLDPEKQGSAAAEGQLIAAQRWPSEKEAIKIYDGLRQAPGVPAPYRLAAMRGAILARGAEGLPLLTDALNSGDLALRGIGLRAARELTGAGVTEALAGELSKVKPEVQAQLIPALADRGEPAAVRGAVESLAASEAGDVRLAALTALGRIGADSSVAPLLKALEARRSAEETAAAQASLARLAAPAANGAILKGLPAAKPEARVALIDTLADRDAAEAAPALLKQAADADAEVSKAAFRALTALARPADLGELIRLAAACPHETARDTAERAAVAGCQKIKEPARRGDPVLAALEKTPATPGRCALLRILGSLGGAKPLAAVQAALLADDKQIQDAALRTLAAWPDAGPLATLLDTVNAKATSPVHRALALRGAIRMAGLAPGDGAWFVKSSQAVRSAEEKTQLLAELAKWKNVRSLGLIRPYLDDTKVRTEAALAVAQAAQLLAETPEGGALKGELARAGVYGSDGRVRPDARGKLAGLAQKGELQAMLARAGVKAPAHNESLTLQVGAVKRTCVVHLPPAYDGAKALPLVISYHGSGGTGVGMAGTTGFNAIADKEGFIAAYPDGITGRSHAWTGLFGTPLPGTPWTQKDGADDVGFTRLLIDQMHDKYHTDAARVFVCGHSSGAYMAYRLAIDLADKIAAAGVVNGSMAIRTQDGQPTIAGIPQPAAPISIIHIAGGKDNLVKFAGGKTDRVIAWSVPQCVEHFAKADGCATTAKETRDAVHAVKRTLYPGGKAGTEVELVVVENCNHNWPTPKEGLSASQELWDFFVKHPKR